jgi:poly-gamma-glutamate capsule biosynthesis protein CapA/YwtB (metallophosphatase superfamily)
MKKHFSSLLLIAFLLFIPIFSLLKIHQYISNNQEFDFFPQASLTITPTIAPTPTPTPTPTPAPISIVFTGDAMFDRHIRTNARKNGYEAILNNLTNIFNQSDLVVTNLEGPITTNNSRSENSVPGSTDNYFFTFDPQVVPVLKKNNINLVNLGNNHILNFGEDGLRQTLDFLDDAELKYFGNTGTDLTEDYVFWQSNDSTAKKLTLAFINHNQFVNDGETKALATIKKIFAEKNEKNIDLIIVYSHWGNEYQTTANEVIQNIAHSFIDAGADLIIGSHPHVVQQSEDLQRQNYLLLT